MDNNEIETEEQTWEVVRSFFRDRGLVRQQIESFDEFIERTINELISDSPPIITDDPDSFDSVTNERQCLEHEIKFGGASIFPPTHDAGDGVNGDILFTPNQARLRNLTYSLKLFAAVDYKVFKITTVKKERIRTQLKSQNTTVALGSIPVMLKSKSCNLIKRDGTEIDSIAFGECPYDQGGYFIINGSEKVLVAQEKMSNNTVRLAFPSSQRVKLIVCLGLRLQEDGAFQV